MDCPGMRMVSPKPLLPQRADSRPSPPSHRLQGAGPRDAGLSPCRQPLSLHPRCSGQPGGPARAAVCRADPGILAHCNSPVGQFPGESSARSRLPIPASGSEQTHLPISVYEPPIISPARLRSPPLSPAGFAAMLWPRGQGDTPPRPRAQPPWCLLAGRAPGQRLPGAAPAVGFGGVVSTQTWQESRLGLRSALCQTPISLEFGACGLPPPAWWWGLRSTPPTRPFLWDPSLVPGVPRPRGTSGIRGP